MSTFQPRQKLGKTKTVIKRSVLHVGQTYRKFADEGYQYQKVVLGCPLIPVHLSWWSISTYNLQENDVIREYRKSLCDEKTECSYLKRGRLFENAS